MFGLFKAAHYKDKALGRFEYSKGFWHGRITLANYTDITLKLSGTSKAPSDDSLNLAYKLPEKFVTLLPALREALYGHYKLYADAGVAEKKINNDDTLWKDVHLAEINISPLDGETIIEFQYHVSWEQEHTLGARIKDWELLELCGSVM